MTTTYDVSQEPPIWVHGQECKCTSKGEHYTTYMCNGIPLMQRRLPNGKVEWEAGYGNEWALEWRWPGQTRPRSPEAALLDLRARLTARRYGIDRQLAHLTAVGAGAVGGVSVREVNATGYADAIAAVCGRLNSAGTASVVGGCEINSSAGAPTPTPPEVRR